MTTNRLNQIQAWLLQLDLSPLTNSEINFISMGGGAEEVEDACEIMPDMVKLINMRYKDTPYAPDLNKLNTGCEVPSPEKKYYNRIFAIGVGGV